jgi:hypothetical protein
MSKKIHIYSTLTCDNIYHRTIPGGADIPLFTDDVMIKGGAGIANDRLITPRGVVTTITEEQLESCRSDPVFKMHEKNGFIQVGENLIDADVAAADMVGRDQSAPLVPADLPADNQPMESEAPAVTTKKKK